MALSKVNRAAIRSGFRSGFCLFLAGAAYVAIDRGHSHISSCSTKAQLRAFAIASIAQAVFVSCFFNLHPEFWFEVYSLKVIPALAFTGIALKKCGFQKCLLKTAGIAFGSLALNYLFGPEKIRKYGEINEVKRSAIKNGFCLFLAGATYVAIAEKYSHISSCSTIAQIGAFEIAGFIQAVFVNFLIENTKISKYTSEPYSSGWPLIILFSSSSMLLTGIALNKCGFQKSLLKTTGIAFGSLALDHLVRKIPDKTLYLEPEEFECLLFNHRLPNRNIFIRCLSLYNHTNLRYLPDGIFVDGWLKIRNCTSLTSLPDGLSVGGTLDLEGCTGLTSLPEGLKVGGNIDLRFCEMLTSFPERLSIGGNLDLEGCINLTSLPSWITELGWNRRDDKRREVNLTGTGLSDDMIDRLRNTPAEGMRFIFGRQAAALDERTFSSLDQALSFWTALDRTAQAPRIVLQESDKADMVQFLGRLSNTAEYRNLQTRTILAKRILKMVSFLAENEETKAKAFEIIHEGLTSCDDRIIASLDDVELLEKIHDAEKDSPSVEAQRKLRSLGLALYRLEEVRRHAAEHMRTLTWVDEVEVQLAFQIGLTQKLGLPLSTQNMLFRGCAGVSDEKIAATGQKILRESTKERIDQFLACWDPWTRHNRRKALPAYEELLLEATPTQGHVQCNILQEEADLPVRHGQNVFGYDAFCKVYVESGKDPCTNMPIDWSDVRRIRCS